MTCHSTLRCALIIYLVSVFMATCNSLRLVIWRHRSLTGCAHLLVRRKLTLLKAFLFLTWPVVLPCLILRGICSVAVRPSQLVFASLRPLAWRRERNVRLVEVRTAQPIRGPFCPRCGRSCATGERSRLRFTYND